MLSLNALAGIHLLLTHDHTTHRRDNSNVLMPLRAFIFF